MAQTERIQEGAVNHSGPEGTLSAIGCALFFIFLGVVIGVGLSWLLVRWWV